MGRLEFIITGPISPGITAQNHRNLFNVLGRNCLSLPPRIRLLLWSQAQWRWWPPSFVYTTVHIFLSCFLLTSFVLYHGLNCPALVDSIRKHTGKKVEEFWQNHKMWIVICQLQWNTHLSPGGAVRTNSCLQRPLSSLQGRCHQTAKHYCEGIMCANTIPGARILLKIKQNLLWGRWGRKCLTEKSLTVS